MKEGRKLFSIQKLSISIFSFFIYFTETFRKVKENKLFQSKMPCYQPISVFSFWCILLIWWKKKEKAFPSKNNPSVYLTFDLFYKYIWWKIKEKAFPSKDYLSVYLAFDIFYRNIPESNGEQAFSVKKAMLSTYRCL